MSASLGLRRGEAEDGPAGGFAWRRRRSGLVSVEEEEEDDDDADACCLKNPYWDPSSPAANSTADPTLPAHAGASTSLSSGHGAGCRWGGRPCSGMGGPGGREGGLHGPVLR
ncbi:hypothetical protein ZWY2020_023801 [Hordeum vulgare]|nr:hypothetical protein ZWY2020_023801 [Hordeum vulgare]